MQSNRITMKATVKSVEVDELGYIWASVYGPLLEDGDSIQFDAMFRPEEDQPGLTPLVLASIALGHKVEIDVEKCGASSYAIVALRLSEKTQAARVLRLAAEMLPNVQRGNWSGAFEKAGLVATPRVCAVAQVAFWEHLQATGRRSNPYGVTWDCFKGLHSEAELDKDAWLKEQIEAFLCTADQLDKENDNED